MTRPEPSGPREVEVLQHVRIELNRVRTVLRLVGEPWFELQRMRDRDELDQVDAPLAAFVFRHEALRTAEPVGELLLRQARLGAGGDQQGNEALMIGRPQRLQDIGLRNGARVYNPASR